MSPTSSDPRGAAGASTSSSWTPRASPRASNRPAAEQIFLSPTLGVVPVSYSRNVFFTFQVRDGPPSDAGPCVTSTVSSPTPLGANAGVPGSGRFAAAANWARARSSKAPSGSSSARGSSAVRLLELRERRLPGLICTGSVAGARSSASSDSSCSVGLIRSAGCGDTVWPAAAAGLTPAPLAQAWPPLGPAVSTEALAGSRVDRMGKPPDVATPGYINSSWP
mmetsp:Transcript_92525/g.251022  ORF Transcript_92525/g.251022 Transcript_92525/m.251022 type:complete len:222 (-) Transcript_92525:577-1242(-)